jgi:hypothetical protein
LLLQRLIQVLLPQLAWLAAFAAFNSCWAEWNDREYDVQPIRSKEEGLQHEAVYPSRDYEPQPDPAVLEGLRIEWREVEVELYSEELIVRGRLVAPPKEGRPQGIEWLQGVRILAARRPDLKPGWTRGHKADDTAVADTVVAQDDRFVARLDLKSFPRSIGSQERFQFAAVLPASTTVEEPRATVVWNGDQGALAGSTTTFIIPGPRKLSPTLHRINAASVFGIYGRGSSNATPLIRAVNHLHGLGKEPAIAALREYAGLATDGIYHQDQESFDPANIEMGDYNVVFWIARLLFEPAKAGTRIPAPAIGITTLPRQDPDHFLWSLDPLELVDDVPFLVGEPINISGVPEHPLWHLRWIERNCVLREKPLRPADDPLAVADQLLALPKAKRREWLPRRDVREQAWQMVADLLPKIEPDEDGDIELTEEDWQMLRRSARERKLRWDEGKQEYVTRG